MKVLAYDEDSYSFTLKAQCENKSKEKTYTFYISDATVNGLMEYSSGYVEISPGKKANMNISFYGLEDDGIEKTSDIHLYYRVYDSDDWFADDVAIGNEHVYPFGKEKADRYSRESEESDVILLSLNGVKVTMIESELGEGIELAFYVENDTDKEVMFFIDDASVNSYMIDPYWAKSLLPYSSAYSSVTWRNKDLLDNLIFEVENIEFTLSAEDYNDWWAPDVASKVINLDF